MEHVWSRPVFSDNPKPQAGHRLPYVRLAVGNIFHSHPAEQHFPSVPVARAVILRTHDQTPPLLRTLVHRLQDVDDFLLVLQHPIQFVVITRPKITHHMFIPKEEHDGARVVEFVHLLEIGHLVQIAEVDDGKVLDAVGDFVEHFVLAHAVGIPVAAEADHHETIFLGHDGLVDVPCGW